MRGSAGRNARSVSASALASGFVSQNTPLPPQLRRTNAHDSGTMRSSDNRAAAGGILADDQPPRTPPRGRSTTIMTDHASMFAAAFAALFAAHQFADHWL